MPCGQSFSHICQIGNHFISLWMMPHIVLCFGSTLAWGFHNIFIVHGKCHGKHIKVGCTMVGLCGVEILSQIFFVHGMC